MSVITLTGCQSNVADDAKSSVDNNKIHVYTSFYVLADFAGKIGGDYVSVSNIIPAGVEPHDFEPSPKQIASIHDADVFIYNGGGFDTWAEKLVKSLDGKVVTVNSTANLHLGELQTEKHDDGDSHEGLDPHVWLDPTNALAQANEIKDALVAYDPAHEKDYIQNFQSLKEKFVTLDKKYQKELSDVPKREIFVSHAAFGYLSNRYNLKQISISGLTPSDEPSPKEMVNIVEQAKKYNVEYILFEPLVQSKYAQAIMNEIGAKSLVMHPIGSLTDEELKNGEDYFSLMEKNLEVLKTALGK